MHAAWNTWQRVGLSKRLPRGFDRTELTDLGERDGLTESHRGLESESSCDLVVPLLDLLTLELVVELEVVSEALLVGVSNNPDLQPNIH